MYMAAKQPMFWSYSTPPFSRNTVLTNGWKEKEHLLGMMAATVTMNVKGRKSLCNQVCALACSLSPSFQPLPRELERNIYIFFFSKTFVLPHFDNFHFLGFLWNGTRFLFKNIGF